MICILITQGCPVIADSATEPLLAYDYVANMNEDSCVQKITGCTALGYVAFGRYCEC